MLIVLEGIDGCGKSAAAAALADALRSAGHDPVAHVDKKSIGTVEATVAERARRLRALIWEAESQRDPMGAEHWLLLIASWYAALPRVQPRFGARAGGTVVVDGWYYRNIAKTVLRAGVDERWCRSLFAAAPCPDAVVLLDVDPRTAWARRPAFSETELGRWDGHHGPPRDAFVAYQSRVREQLRLMARHGGWTVVAPDPGDGPGAVAATIAERLPAGARREPSLPTLSGDAHVH